METREPAIIHLEAHQGFEPLNIDQPTIVDLSRVPVAGSRLLQSLLKSRERAIIAAPLTRGQTINRRLWPG